MEVDKFGHISFVLIWTKGLNHLSRARFLCVIDSPDFKSIGAEDSLQNRLNIGIDVVRFEPSKSSINATPL